MLDIIGYLVILIWMIILLIVSYITKRLLRYDIGPFKPLLNFLRFVGVFIHELSHFTIGILVGVRPKGFQVKMRSPRTGKTAPHGAVPFNDHNMTFLQAVLISLAPIIIATWLFFWCLTLAFTETLDLLLRVIAGFLCVSLLLGGAPSGHDFRIIGHWFKKDPRYSLYQVFLVIISGAVVWFVLVLYRITLLADILFYILIGICYYLVKYTFLAIGKIGYLIRSQRPTDMNYKCYTRNRFKPAKNHKSEMITK